MRALPSGNARTYSMHASTFGSMEPGANWPWAMNSSASAMVIVSISAWSGLPKFTQTFSTAVRMTSMSAPKSAASLADERSLSMTAGTPSYRPSFSNTGTPPPPVDTTT